MGHKIGIGGYQNTGKSFGRRYIPDGENVMILAPSKKVPHLFTGPADAKELSKEEIDEAIKEGKRKMVKPLRLTSPEKKWKDMNEFRRLGAANAKNAIPGGMITEVDALKVLIKDKPTGYFTPQSAPGNIILCERLELLDTYTQFINKHMPWIHTIITPDFTHYITNTVVSSEFRNKQFGADQYKKYMDLAADALKKYIQSAESLREELVIVSEFHVEFKEQEGFYELFVPGGKMVKEKFLPSSYYDVFMFTEVTYEDPEQTKPIYNFVTNKTHKYPEARGMGIFEDTFIPNNLQTVLTKFRQYNGIELPDNQLALIQ